MLGFFATSDLYTYAWFKYAKKVSDIKDVYELMLDHKIGFHKKSSFVKIARFYEERVFDLREADRIYLLGIKLLQNVNSD